MNAGGGPVFAAMFVIGVVVVLGIAVALGVLWLVLQDRENRRQ